MYVRRINQSVLDFSLSWHRHPHICVPCNSRLIWPWGSRCNPLLNGHLHYPRPGTSIGHLQSTYVYGQSDYMCIRRYHTWLVTNPILMILTIWGTITSTQVHGFFLQPNFALPEGDPPRSIDYSVSDSRVEFVPVPTPRSWSSLSNTHRFMVFFQVRPRINQGWIFTYHTKYWWRVHTF